MPATQSLIPVIAIKEGIIVLKNGEWRAILLASSMNFGLLSPEEQDAVIYQYQNFLNSLDFNVQILVTSRKVNIRSYIKILQEIEEKQESELLRVQAKEYKEFIKGLSEMVNLMSKSFYIVIPFYPMAVGKRKLSEEDFARYKTQITQRIEYVLSGLRRTGVHAVHLGNDEVVELLWSYYNPADLEKGEIPAFPST
ncbi:MAG: hypothetical protein O2U61_02655 [Candidatus Bathyarchaeota archaeon]|nr:hypothetical protein [Candidatus Bathyarchaeota archaeon]